MALPLSFVSFGWLIHNLIVLNIGLQNDGGNTTWPQKGDKENVDDETIC